jgi:hypothetical protein
VTYGFAPLGSTLTFAGITVFAFEGTAPICAEFKSSTRLQNERIRPFRRDLLRELDESNRFVQKSAESTSS